MVLMKARSIPIILMVLLSVVVIIPESKKADMPIEEITLSFSSVEDLNSFFETNKFTTFKYQNGMWKEDIVLDKSKMFKKNWWYILAPYSYEDSSGYMHKIKKSAYITISNIDEDITVIITGFEEATVTVRNFGGKVVFGRVVELQKVSEEEGSWMQWILGPVQGMVLEIGKQISRISHINEYYPAVYGGMKNCIITVDNAKGVVITNYLITKPIDTPIYINNVNYASFNSVAITPSVYSKVGSSAITVRNTHKVSFSGFTEIKTYHYGLKLENIENLEINGVIAIDGMHKDAKTGIISYEGVGIYASNVGNLSGGGSFGTTRPVYIEIGEEYIGWITAKAVGNYNETNQTFWGAIKELGFFVIPAKFTGSDYYYIGGIADYIPISQKINLTEDNPTINISCERGYNYQNDDWHIDITMNVKFNNLTVSSNTTGIIQTNQVNNTTYIVHEDMELRLLGFMGNGSTISGFLPATIRLKNLTVGLGVPDDGRNESELVEYINATALKENVEHPIAYHVGFIGGYAYFDTPLVFGGLSAICSLFVAIGWIRIGFMMFSRDHQKKTQAKELLKNATIGTIIVAMVIFGWANLMGLFNWIFGG